MGCLCCNLEIRFLLYVNLNLPHSCFRKLHILCIALVHYYVSITFSYLLLWSGLAKFCILSWHWNKMFLVFKYMIVISIIYFRSTMLYLLCWPVLSTWNVLLAEVLLSCLSFELNASIQHYVVVNLFFVFSKINHALTKNNLQRNGIWCVHGWHIQ